MNLIFSSHQRERTKTSKLIIHFITTKVRITNLSEFLRILTYSSRMSDAGDDIPIATEPVVEVTTEAPKGKLSVEEALQVRYLRILP